MMEDEFYVDSYALTEDVDVVGMRARLAAAPRRVTVVVPVFNALDALYACIDALFRNTAPWVEILLMDDASTDPDVKTALSWAERHRPGVRVVRNSENLGFTRNVNKALALVTSGDVALLNSDTEVGPAWLERMRWVAYSQARVGTVSAVSNFAGTMSVPEPHRDNAWHVRMPWESTSRMVAREMYVWSQQVPAAHGFCMFLTRLGLDAVGGLDAEAFPRGYGEEVDYSQRGLKLGLVNLVAPHVFVKHRRAQSFGSERNELSARSKPILAQRHPRLRQDVADWSTSVPDRLIRLVARRLQHSAPASCLRRVILASDEALAAPEHHTVSLRLSGGAPALRERCVCSRELVSWQADPSGSMEDLVHAIMGVVIRAGIEGIVLDGAQSSEREVLHTVAEVLRLPVDDELPAHRPSDQAVTEGLLSGRG